MKRSSFSKRCSASTQRTVPERERMTQELVRKGLTLQDLLTEVPEGPLTTRASEHGQAFRKGLTLAELLIQLSGTDDR